MKALIWKKAFRAGAVMALGPGPHVHHAPTGRGRESIQTRVIPEVSGSLDGHQHSSGLPSSPGDQHPQTPVLGTQGGEGEGAPLPRVTGGQPAGSCRTAFRGLRTPSCSPPPPQSKIPRSATTQGWQGCEGVGGRRQRAQGSSEAEGWLSEARVLRQEKAPRDPPHYKQ